MMMAVAIRHFHDEIEHDTGHEPDRGHSTRTGIEGYRVEDSASHHLEATTQKLHGLGPERMKSDLHFAF